MIKPEQVPLAAWIAASRVDDKNDIGEVIAAALNAWPGMYQTPLAFNMKLNDYFDSLLLPLPTQEPGDE